METVPFHIKVREHFRRHRRKYVVTGGICLAIGGVIGAFTVRTKQPTIIERPNTLSVEHPAIPAFDKLKNVIFDGIGNADDGIVKIIGRNGHPGNVIYCNETKQLFKSHREATRELGIDSRDLWAYLKGLKPDARGYTFKRIGEAQKTIDVS